MTNDVSNRSELAGDTERSADVWVAILTVIVTATTFVVAILTPPKSGPFCALDCIDYARRHGPCQTPGSSRLPGHHPSCWVNSKQVEKRDTA